LTGVKRKSLVYFQYFIMIIVAVIMFFPVLWIISSALKNKVAIGAYPPVLIPDQIRWENFSEVWSRTDVPAFLKNTMILIVGNTFGTILSSTLVAYPLARMNFKGKNIVFGMILATMMVPATATIIPQYILFSKFGWLNSYLPMVVPAFFAYPYNVFLFRQFFRTIPISLDESANLDGCNKLQVLTKILIPLSKPIFVTVAVLSTIHWWNELFAPLIYIDSLKKMPLTVGALTACRQAYAASWNNVMAMAVMMIIPPIILYLFAGKYLVEGIKTTGMKN